MNKKGFTLVELLSVIVLLGLIITISARGITNADKNAKKKIFYTKIKNIEKAAVLYSYDEHYIGETKNEFNLKDSTEGDSSNNYCYNIENCFYYSAIITVNDLLDEHYLKADDGVDILDPTKTNDNLNKCKIQIYKKYKKVYAILMYDSDCKEVSDE